MVRADDAGPGSSVRRLAVLALLPTARAANWAQVSGALLQSTTIPYIPAPRASDPPRSGGADFHQHFSRRFGHASAAVGNFTGAGPGEPEEHLFVMGGDTYRRRASRKTGLLAAETVPTDAFLGGYTNDVWRATVPADEWLVEPRVREDRTGAGDYRPAVRSRFRWTLVNPGKVPPAGVAYHAWVRCQAPFRTPDDRCEDGTAPPGLYLEDNMWSPRRHHQLIGFKGKLFVMGGRAREHEPISPLRTVGEIADRRAGAGWREPSVLKNDVWSSADGGRRWELVSPGCVDPQLELVSAGSAQERTFWGSRAARCVTSADCFGVAECVDLPERAAPPSNRACVCPMWSAREQFALAAHEGHMYVSGGIVSVRESRCGRFACGDVDAGSLRRYVSDVWYSADGATWARLGEPRAQAHFAGRAGHSMLAAEGRLYVLGGRGASVTAPSRDAFFDDVWRTAVLGDGAPGEAGWHEVSPGERMGPRANHVAVLEPRSEAHARNVTRIYVHGGIADGGAVLGDSWSWTLNESQPSAEPFVRDYSSAQRFRSAAGAGRGDSYAAGSPAQHYIDMDSDVGLLEKIYLPRADADDDRSDEERTRDSLGQGAWPRRRRKPIMTDGQLAMLRAEGVHTIRDLILMDKYAVLRLRGFDVPQVPAEQRHSFDHVCDVRELAIALWRKCRPDPRTWRQDGHDGLPFHNSPAYAKGPMGRNALWHGKNYSDTATTADGSLEAWDGCAPRGDTRKVLNVDGIGDVTQRSAVRDPWRELEEFQCRQGPGARAYATGAFFRQKVYLIGGMDEKGGLHESAWYRDDRIPRARMAARPTSGTSESRFDFRADEDGCAFEYKVFDSDERLDVLRWTPAQGHADVRWLSRWAGGPGKGTYTMYVRCRDAAGNVDHAFAEGENMHTWYYADPPPADLILACVLSALVILILACSECRRRRRMAAMRRRALRRMRRRFGDMAEEGRRAPSDEELGSGEARRRAQRAARAARRGRPRLAKAEGKRKKG